MRPPKLSVIVVCISAASVREKCLAALVPQLVADDVEVLVVGHDDQPNGGAIRARYPELVWISTPRATTVPRMRSQAMSRSRGAIVALLEDDCVVTDDWCEQTIRAHAAPFPAIGGPIEPGGDYRPLDWANYFCEYGRFMAPFLGFVAALPGNNVSYKRAALADRKADDGFYDVFFHERLRRSGQALYADPNLVARNVNRWSLAQLTTTPFHHGKAFAGQRAASFPRWRRWLFAVLTAGLPAIKVVRVAREVFGRHRNVGYLLRSLHWIALFALSWSLGEFSGYLIGAGDSPSRWR
ncbi:MAG: glycosyltransferase [Chloroflexota bacterium]